MGFLYINSENRVKPLIDGGAQERNQRGGTENVYGIVGLAKALELAVANLDERRARIESVRNYLINRLLEEFDDIRYQRRLGRQLSLHHPLRQLPFLAEVTSFSF